MLLKRGRRVGEMTLGHNACDVCQPTSLYENVVTCPPLETNAIMVMDIAAEYVANIAQNILPSLFTNSSKYHMTTASLNTSSLRRP